MNVQLISSSHQIERKKRWNFTEIRSLWSGLHNFKQATSSTEYTFVRVLFDLTRREKNFKFQKYQNTFFHSPFSNTFRWRCTVHQNRLKYLHSNIFNDGKCLFFLFLLFRWKSVIWKLYMCCVIYYVSLMNVHICKKRMRTQPNRMSMIWELSIAMRKLKEKKDVNLSDEENENSSKNLYGCKIISSSIWWTDSI